MVDTADAAPPVVRAQSFELVNATGETRAVLGTLDDVPLLGFVDASGVHRAALLLDTDGSPGIFLRDQDAPVRASLYLNDGSPTLGLQQAEDGGHVEARIDHAGARIVLQDRNDTIRAALTMGATGQPALLLQDAGGAIRLRGTRRRRWNANSLAPGHRERPARRAELTPGWDASAPSPRRIRPAAPVCRC